MGASPQSQGRCIGRVGCLLVAIAGLLAASRSPAAAPTSAAATESRRRRGRHDDPVDGEPLTISTGPLYIDKSQGSVDGPGSTLDKFTEETGIDVNYLEDINSNESFFAKLRPELENGSSGGRDILVATDWMARRYHDLGYLQDIDLWRCPTWRRTSCRSFARRTSIPTARSPSPTRAE